MPKIRQFTAGAESNKQRLDIFLSKKLGVSRSQTQKMIKNRLVSVNKKQPKKSGDRIKTGDKINILKPDSQQRNSAVALTDNNKKNKKYAFADIKVIKENKDYLIIEKPAGLIVHASSANESNTLADILVKQYPELKKVGEDKIRPGIVHRLDRDASGLMIIARTQKMFNHLKQQFKERKIDKEYLALTRGKIEADYAKINLPIARSKNSERMVALPVPGALRKGSVKLADFNKISRIKKQYAKSRNAITEFWVEKRFLNFTLLRVKTHTGRTHQIRVHLLAYDHPIAGDKLYCQKKKRGIDTERLFLHCAKLGFIDLNNNQQEFESKLPRHLNAFLKKIRVI